MSWRAWGLLVAVLSAGTPAPAPARPPVAETSLAPLVKRVRPTVVGVTTTRHMRADSEFMRRFFGGGGSEEIDGIGSGVIIDPKGLVLTNNHVVEGAEEVTVKLSDDHELPAEVVGTDPDTDIAVLRVKGLKQPLPAAQLGNSDQVQVGDYVVAIGNPFGLFFTVTSGIVSAKARVIGAGPFDEFLQTDAAINPGNSGGPLFDVQGRVVGINTAIVASGQGIGFAVPITLVQALLPQLVSRGRVTRGLLGVSAQDLTPELAQAMGVPQTRGALVADVQPGSAAQKAGIRTGDVLVRVGGQPVEGAAQLSRMVALTPPGTKERIDLVRDGRARTVEATLGTRPSKAPRQAPSNAQEDSLGWKVRPVPPELRARGAAAQGALVTDVTPGSRASRAGLQAGDVIVEADRKPVGGPPDLTRITREHQTEPLLLRVMRQGNGHFLVIPPG